MNAKKTKHILDAFEKSMWLWPDPFLSPWVPPQKTLIEFIKNPNSLNKDLRKHIMLNIDCKRAVDSIKFDQDSMLREVFSLSDSHDKNSLPNSKEILSTPKQTINIFNMPSKGMIVKARETFKIFEKGRERTGYVFLSPKILILNNGELMPWGKKKVFRAVAVTPAGLFSSIKGLDYNTESGWTVHLWLTYPVSLDQINTNIHLGTIDEIDEIINGIQKYESSDIENIYFGLDQQRLLDMASSLPASADAEMARYEWIQSVFKNFEEKTLREIKETPYMVAADSKEASRLLVRTLNKEDKLLSAELEDPIYLSSDTKENEPLPTWIIPKEKIALEDGTIFILKDFRNGKIIGNGTIYGNIAKLEEFYSSELELPISKAEDLMLEVFANG